MKMLVLILDALDADNIYEFDLSNIQGEYEKSGDVLGISTLPHTAVSNPMIWGGIKNESKYWVEEDDKTSEYTDPAQHFDRSEGKPVEGASGFSRNEDYDEESFIWDDLTAAGYDARALQVPIVLPPYSFNVTDELEDSWFPDTEERMGEHIRTKPNLIKKQFDDGADFVGTSIQMPDKWLHGIPEGKCDEEWVRSEAPVLDEKVADLLEYCKDNGIEFVVFGDHGSPAPGAMKTNGYILPRHRKESIIFSSSGLNHPVYTGDLYNWMRDLYGVDEVGESMDDKEEDIDTNEVDSRLEALGYK